MSEKNTMADQNVENSKPSEQFFIGLCDNISAGISAHFQSVSQILNFNDELMIHSGVPTSAQLHLSLSASQLQRTFMFLRSLVEELVRLTKLYSTSWEEKNQCLKALHQQYNTKQRKLDIALTKIKLLTGRNKALEKIRIRHNWEKMFLKVNQGNNSTSTSLGWKQVVKDYRQTIASGDDVTPFFKNLSLSEKDNDRKKYTVNVDKLSKGYDSLYVDGSSLNEDLDYQSVVTDSENNQNMFSTEEEDDEDDCEEDELKFVATPRSVGNNKLSRLSNVKQWITESIRKNSNDDDTHQQKPQIENKEAFVQTNTKVMIDSGINTRTVSYDNVLNVLIRAPEMLLRRFPDLRCSVALGSKLTKLSLVSGGSNKANVGFTYSTKLDFEGKYVLQSRDIIESTLRVGFHPDENEQMIAFSATPLVELKIVLFDCNNFVPAGKKEPKKAVMYSNDTKDLIVQSTVDDKDYGLKFNQPCDSTTIRCCINQSPLPFNTDKSVETISLGEFVDDILRAHRHAQLQRCRSACVETDEKPVYTESDLETVRGDLTTKLQELKDNYDEQIESLLSTHSVAVGVGNEGEFPNIATSPIDKTMVDGSAGVASSFLEMSTQSSVVAEDDEKQTPSLSTATKTKSNPSAAKSLKVSAQWGKDLPANFLTRVCKFQEASHQYHQELRTRTTTSVTREITKKLNAEKKLSVVAKTSQNMKNRGEDEGNFKSKDNDSVFARDLYLPAVFMPFKLKKSDKRQVSGRSYLRNIHKQQHHQPPTALQKLQLPFVMAKLNKKSEVGGGSG